MIPQEKGKILIVDDEKDLVEMLAYQLNRRGYQTLKAFDGVEAWEKIESEKPDLLILDLMMPNLDGWELCRLIRRSQNRTLRAIAILMLTARATQEDKIYGLEIGADDYLVKPFSLNELVLRVEKMMEKQRSMTQLQEEIKHLQSSMEAKEFNLKQVAHDLKSPLISIGFSAKRMLRRESNEEASKALQTIFDNSLQLTQWIDETLLAHPSSESNRQEDRKEVEVNALILQTIDLLKEMASEKGINVVFHATPPHFKLSLHEPLMHRVLMNLLSNALKYTPRGGKVEITLKYYFSKRGTGVMEIAVSDNGIGIPEDEIERIFEPYYRGKNISNEEGKGTGLSFVKKVIDMHGGRILVQSEINKGSTFSILLPIKNAPTEATGKVDSKEVSLLKQ